MGNRALGALRKVMVCVVAGSLLGGCAPPAAESGAQTEEEEEEEEETAELPTETERFVLHEVFSGSNCGPCTEADANVLEVLHANEGKYVLMSYQVGSDPYVSGESVSRRLFYLPGESSYSVPFCHADGVNGFHPNEMNDEAGYLQEDFDRFYSLPSALQLEASHTVTDQTVDINVSLLPLADYPSETLVLHVAIIENTTYLNVGSNGQTEFHNVMKKMVPSVFGTELGPLARGGALEFQATWTFNGEYTSETGFSDHVVHLVEHTVEEFDDLSVVAFVQDSETWEVHQSVLSPSQNIAAGR